MIRLLCWFVHKIFILYFWFQFQSSSLKTIEIFIINSLLITYVSFIQLVLFVVSKLFYITGINFGQKLYIIIIIISNNNNWRLLSRIIRHKYIQLFPSNIGLMFDIFILFVYLFQYISSYHWIITDHHRHHHHPSWLASYYNTHTLVHISIGNYQEGRINVMITLNRIFYLVVDAKSKKKC